MNCFTSYMKGGCFLVSACVNSISCSDWEKNSSVQIRTERTKQEFRGGRWWKEESKDLQELTYQIHIENCYIYIYVCVCIKIYSVSFWFTPGLVRSITCIYWTGLRELFNRNTLQLLSFDQTLGERDIWS